MIFTSPEFVLFALTFFALYALLPRRTRKTLLLLASYAFYGSWDARFLALLLASTLVDFVVARKLHAEHQTSTRRSWLLVSLAVNLSALAFFKYAGFFVEEAAHALSAVGIDAPRLALDIVLPVGISFYTFQTLSYTIDVYRRDLEPTQSLLDFAIYVSFFPQLVAGPIERAAQLLPQLSTLTAHPWRPVWSGIGLIALGAFKKTVLADNFAALTESVYSDVATAHPLAVWIGTYAFAVQIYCDFSGYSDIAIGLGRLLGLELMQNFASPYAAAGPSEFWRRWHISLSTWLRDYLYIPLGGNRGGVWRVRRSLFVTMLLGGLWHGAAWNYVLWGAFHGVLLLLLRGPSVERALARLQALPTATRALVVVARRVAFFHIVCVGWSFFRASSLTECITLLEKLFFVDGLAFAAFADGVKASHEGRYLAFMGVVFLVFILGQNLWPVGSKRVVDVLWRMPISVRYVVCASLLYAAMIFTTEAPPPFIYFQF
jgi:alginate O-acetyltransferase complex protein AlgI